MLQLIFLILVVPVVIVLGGTLLAEAIKLFFDFWYVSFPLALAIGAYWEEGRIHQGKGYLWSFGAGFYGFYAAGSAAEGWLSGSTFLAVVIAAITGLVIFQAAREWSVINALVKIGSWLHLPTSLVHAKRQKQEQATYSFKTEMGWINVAGESNRKNKRSTADDPEVADNLPQKSEPGDGPKLQSPNYTDPMYADPNKGIIRQRADAIVDSMRVRAATKLYKDLADYWDSVKTALVAKRQANEEWLRSDEEEFRATQQQIEHEREIGQKQREAEKLQYDKEIAQTKKELEDLEQEPEPEMSEEEKIAQELDEEIKWEEIRTMKEWERQDAIHRARKKLLSEHPDRAEEIEDFIHQRQQEVLRKSFEVERDAEPEDY